MKREINVQVEFSPGYEKRFTQACLDQLKKRKKEGNDEKKNREAS